MNTKIKDTYLYKVNYEEPEILAMGAGSILGGLIGGTLIDKRSSNSKAEFKSKVGEAIIQMGNISVPILSVGQCARLGDKIEKSLENNLSTNASKTTRIAAKVPKLGLCPGSCESTKEDFSSSPVRRGCKRLVYVVQRSKGEAQAESHHL